MTAGHSAVAIRLIRAGAVVEWPNWFKQLPLLTAVGQDDLSLVTALLGAEADVDRKSGILHSTALVEAAKEGSVPIVTVLLKRGAEIDRTGGLRATTPVIAAAIEGHADVLRLLLEHRANASLKDASGLTALHWAASLPSLECVELLLAHGADPLATSPKGATPAELAAANGYSEVAKRLSAAAEEWRQKKQPDEKNRAPQSKVPGI